MTTGEKMANKLISVLRMPGDNGKYAWWVGLDLADGALWDTSTLSRKHANICACTAREALSKEIDSELPMNTYQELAASTAVYPNRDKNLVYTILGLVGESGELAEKMKKAIRDNKGRVDKNIMVKELGDVLWYVAMVASELGVSLRDVAQKNVEKLKDRRQRNVLHGSGDDR